MSARRIASALAVLFVTLALPSTARAEDPDRVEWSKDWPRMRVAEVVDVIGLTLGSYAIDRYWTPPSSPHWRGALLFDNPVRSLLRGRSLSVQTTASDASDYLYKIGTLAPYVVDVFFVTLSIHENADVALEMLLMNMQSLGLAGVTTLATEHAVGRERPYVRDCQADGTTRDANGNVLLNHCGTIEDFQSFDSGHAAAVTTMAGLTCAHHQHLPLYGGGFADLAPCLVMIGAAASTGVARVVADRHWATDVVAGYGVGILSGYVLPSVLHYGFTSGHPVGEIRTKNVRLVPAPMMIQGGAGFSLIGLF